MNKTKPKVKKRRHYRHRFANPKLGYAKEYADKCDQIDWGK